MIDRYERLWAELTAPQTWATTNGGGSSSGCAGSTSSGYDVAQIQINEKDGDPHVLVQTQVVEAGHHRRRLLDLTGLKMQENQARRILNDLDTYRSRAVMPETEVDEDTVARHWVTDMFEPVIEAIPADLAAKLEPAEIFHEVLEHRWFLSEAAGHEVSMEQGGAVLHRQRVALPSGRAGHAGSGPDGATALLDESGRR